MSLNATPSGDRVHIGLFGRRNAGKSSLINALTGQELAIVSATKGTTTDPVKKAMELLPLGPVLFIDTPGLDDSGELGSMRVEKARQALNHTDIALVVVDATVGVGDEEKALIEVIEAKAIPYLTVLNKCDLLAEHAPADGSTVCVSAATGEGIEALKEKIAAVHGGDEGEKSLLADVVTAGDTVVLVVPIDKAAPKGRLILPQQQTIRAALEIGATAVVCRETELSSTLSRLKSPPKLVVTDSQVFAAVAAMLRPEQALTSFSILFARHKGDLATLVAGARALDDLGDGDRILIAEGCTHHRQCEDIGTVKLPKLLREHCGKELRFDFVAGVEFPADLARYRLVIHCGGCTLNRREMCHRIATAKAAGVPITNYGVALSHLTGILPRTIAPLIATAP